MWICTAEKFSSYLDSARSNPLTNAIDAESVHRRIIHYSERQHVVTDLIHIIHAARKNACTSSLSSHARGDLDHAPRPVI